MPVYRPAPSSALLATRCEGRYGPAGVPLKCPGARDLRAGPSDPRPHLCAACGAARVAHNQAAFAADGARNRPEWSTAARRWNAATPAARAAWLERLGLGDEGSRSSVAHRGAWPGCCDNAAWLDRLARDAATGGGPDAPSYA